MCRVEPVEQLLVAAAALAVVRSHADNGKNAEPLIVDCEHLGKGKTGRPRTCRKTRTKSHRKVIAAQTTSRRRLWLYSAYSTMPPARKDQPPSVMDVHKGSGAVMTHANTAEPIGAS